MILLVYWHNEGAEVRCHLFPNRKWDPAKVVFHYM